MNQKHALVIGGTGMLANVCLWLADGGFNVSVIGRSIEKHRQLVKRANEPRLINSLMVDYNNPSLLEKEVRKAIEKNGLISLVVSWIPFLPSLEMVNRVVSEQNSSWKLYQVKGSRRYFKDDILHVPSNCEHRSIYLGFILEGNQSRWLTNNEIAEGVIKSITEDNIESIIGMLHPYAKRPKG
jgi:hypothetical protein